MLSLQLQNNLSLRITRDTIMRKEKWKKIAWLRISHFYSVNSSMHKRKVEIVRNKRSPTLIARLQWKFAVIRIIICSWAANVSSIFFLSLSLFLFLLFFQLQTTRRYESLCNAFWPFYADDFNGTERNNVLLLVRASALWYSAAARYVTFDHATIKYNCNVGQLYDYRYCSSGLFAHYRPVELTPICSERDCCGR